MIEGILSDKIQNLIAVKNYTKLNENADNDPDNIS